MEGNKTSHHMDQLLLLLNISIKYIPHQPLGHFLKIFYSYYLAVKHTYILSLHDGQQTTRRFYISSRTTGLNSTLIASQDTVINHDIFGLGERKERHQVIKKPDIEIIHAGARKVNQSPLQIRNEVSIIHCLTDSADSKRATKRNMTMLTDTSTDGAIISLNIEILYTYSNKINAKLLQIC